ncbi:MAG: hypothetical protein KBC93_17960 [Candidatus Microthrix sp.]|nr:hypothetical protein [Candidatus Microthrix sp.]
MGVLSWLTRHADNAAATGAQRAALTTVRPRTLTPAGVALLEAVQSTEPGHWPGCHREHAACLARRVLEEIR